MFGNGDVIDLYSAATTTDEISVDGRMQKSFRRERFWLFFHRWQNTDIYYNRSKYLWFFPNT